MALRLRFRLSVLETCNSQQRDLHALRPFHGTAAIVGEREWTAIGEE